MTEKPVVSPMGKVIRTSAGLRDALFDEIELLRSGKGDVTRAKMVGALAGQIVACARLEIDWTSEVSEGKPKAQVPLQLGKS